MGSPVKRHKEGQEDHRRVKEPGGWLAILSFPGPPYLQNLKKHLQHVDSHEDFKFGVEPAQEEACSGDFVRKLWR